MSWLTRRVRACRIDTANISNFLLADWSIYWFHVDSDGWRAWRLSCPSNRGLRELHTYCFSSLASNLLDWAPLRAHQLTYFRRWNLITRGREHDSTRWFRELSKFRGTRDESRVTSRGQCDWYRFRNIAHRQRDGSFNFLPTAKAEKATREEKSMDVPRENEGNGEATRRS